jgi:hypothetical protein
LYPFTPTLSVDADHESVTDVAVAALVVRLVGAEGAVVSLRGRCAAVASAQVKMIAALTPSRTVRQTRGAAPHMHRVVGDPRAARIARKGAFASTRATEHTDCW